MIILRGAYLDMALFGPFHDWEWSKKSSKRSVGGEEGEEGEVVRGATPFFAVFENLQISALGHFGHIF